MESPKNVGMQESRAEPSLESAIRKFTEAFNRQDVKAVVSCWAEDGTLITPTGEIGKGRSGVETAYRHDTETILAGTTSKFELQSVRRLGDDLAFLDLDHELRHARMPDGSRGTMNVHIVMLAKRSGRGWQRLDARPSRLLPQPPAVH